MLDLSHSKAVGYLQGACVASAIDIEIIVKNLDVDDWTKPVLQQIAERLRRADFVATALVDPDSTTSSQINTQGDR